MNVPIPDLADLECGESVDETNAHIQKVLDHGHDRFESIHRRKDGSNYEVKVSTQYMPVKAYGLHHPGQSHHF